MEGLFGNEFSRVRVHADADASASARAVRAPAYTVRNDIVFAQGQYQPGSMRGDALIAHELTHVSQQQGVHSPDRRTLRFSTPTGILEHEAAHMAGASVLTTDVEARTRSSNHGAQRTSPPAFHRVGSEPVVQRANGAALFGGILGAVVGAIAGALLGGLGGAIAGGILGGGVGALIGALSGGSTALPSVSVGNFRNTGAVSPENQCPLCRRIPGLGADPGSGSNFMELRGDITGHRANVEYEFRRSKEVAVWQRVGTSWTMLDYDPPGTMDDARNLDEDLTPHNDHIYAIDGPGFNMLQRPVPDFSAEEAVYRGTYREYVEVRLGSAGAWTRNSNVFEWHSLSWLERVGGAWQRKPGWNRIEPGSTYVGQSLPYGLGDYPLLELPAHG